MTQKTLASQISIREGKKHEASIGDIREIIKITEMIFAEEATCSKGVAFKPGPLFKQFQANIVKKVSKLKKAAK